LTTSEGTWTFGAQATDGLDWNTQLNGNANGWGVQMQITNGNLYTVNKVNGHWYLRQNAAWVDASDTAPDGAIIYGGQPGILTTPEGTWTFGAQATDGVDWNTQLNGSANGWGVQMQITNGNLYTVNKVNGHWYVRQNAAWVDAGTTAPDGAIIYGGQPGILTTTEGTWTFGGQATDGVDWNTQLNGNANGWGVQMQITNGNLYTVSKVSGHWYVRQNGSWVDAGTTAPVEAATPTAITFSPASATTPDNAPAGTVLTTATVTMSDGSQFKGTLTSSDTSGFFAISGLNIVTARALTPADDGTHSTTITAFQGGQSVSMELSI
jgi:hypothetical protein